MRVSRSDTFIYEKRVKFQVEFPVNEIQFPGSQNPLDRIFYTYAYRRPVSFPCLPHVAELSDVDSTAQTATSIPSIDFEVTFPAF